MLNVLFASLPLWYIGHTIVGALADYDFLPIQVCITATIQFYIQIFWIISLISVCDFVKLNINIEAESTSFNYENYLLTEIHFYL